MGSEFLKGYCTLAEGEKDPRNLKMAFSLDRIMLLEFDLKDSVEDLFDVTFCYFPITFTPPPDDPYGITSEELQADLRACLASTPLFGPLALPLVLDKLQASTKSAKVRTLHVGLSRARTKYVRADTKFGSHLLLFPHLWQSITR